MRYCLVMHGRTLIALGALTALLLVLPSPAHAYIGPGAGFAFLSSFLFVLGAALVAFFLLLTLPLRLLFRALRLRKRQFRAQVGRLVIVGLDGLDPELAAEFMAKGALPNLSRLEQEGRFAPLKTTNPPISPVAWSTFMTGTNPGKHNIFDFLRRDPKNYLPALSSADISASDRATRRGKLLLPRGKPRLKLLRRSVPFWKLLGDHGIFSVILKVPITFPPERFNGLLLSGLCAPDLKGSQGTFAFYTSGEPAGKQLTSGYHVHLEGGGPAYSTFISGPPDPFRKNEYLKIPLSIRVSNEKNGVDLAIGRRRYALPRRTLSPWIPLTFRAGPLTRIRGIAQFYLKSVSPRLELYLSPIQIDPEKPALPISHPFIYSIYLAKLFDSFATLGLPQDTWALNEGALTDDGFLEQTARIQSKLEEIFFHALRRLKAGLLCCVFDTSDVIQHEFWRYREPDHPALKAGDQVRPEIIEDMYRRMDSLVGKTLARLKPTDLLLVISDHGFKLFRRGVNLNTWLKENGYLHLKDGESESGEWFEKVDWSRTRAYAFGLSGLFLNRRGREQQGIVPAEEAAALKEELARKLTGCKDEERGGGQAIAAVYDTEKIYRGPYKENAPDLIVGYSPGYRCSWDSVTGKIVPGVFVDNEKAWSADHCIDHRFVPGVFFSSRPTAAEQIGLVDLAPTVLTLFGIKPPPYMDGNAIEFAASQMLNAK